MTESNNWLAKFAYGIGDQLYITSQLFRKNASEFTHIGGGRVTTKEATLAVGMTGASLIPGEAFISGVKGAGVEVNGASEIIKDVSLEAAETSVSRVFWSGSKIAKQEAADFAKNNGMKTLEMTPQGRVMNTISPYLLQNPIALIQ